MQRFTISFIGFFVCFNAVAGVYLPVVDVSNGAVSARAAFGEEVVKPQNVTIAPMPKNIEKKVVARNTTSAKKVKTTRQASEQNFAGDILKPLRPSSDLWANNDTPLRMPRMDEISVVRSDAALPEETLNYKPIRVAKHKPVAKKSEAISELNALREEIARLTERQKRTEENLALARGVAMQESVAHEPIVSEPTVKEKLSESHGGVNVRREVVPMETKRDVVMRSVNKKEREPKIVSLDNKMSRMSPTELKKAFKKTYLSENKHLSTYVDDKYDVASDVDSEVEFFSAQRDLSEMDSGVRPLEIKIAFMNGDSGLSRDNYTLLSETASIVVNNPKRAIQIAIPESVTHNQDTRKLAARRLAIVEQVLRDTGVAEQRIVPVLSQRGDDVFVLRVISGDTFESLNRQKRSFLGENNSKKTYKSMSW